MSDQCGQTIQTILIARLGTIRNIAEGGLSERSLSEIARLAKEVLQIAGSHETEAGLQIVAFVPVHPKHGPLWANVVTSQDADRPAHYPMIPLYARIEAPAQKVGERR